MPRKCFPELVEVSGVCRLKAKKAFWRGESPPFSCSLGFALVRKLLAISGTSAVRLSCASVAVRPQPHYYVGIDVGMRGQGGDGW